MSFETPALIHPAMDLNQSGALTELHKASFSADQNILSSVLADSSQSWLKGFSITEGTGAVLGAAGGGLLAYGVGRGVGTVGAAVFNTFLRTNISASAVKSFAAETSLSGVGYGALAGLSVAGIGYGLYKGCEYAFESKASQA